MGPTTLFARLIAGVPVKKNDGVGVSLPVERMHVFDGDGTRTS